MVKAYFGNCVNDKISVNLNFTLANEELLPRTQSSDEKEPVSIVLSAVSFDIGPTPTKGKFGTDGPNMVEIEFEVLESSSNLFEIEVSDALKGQNLYFYVFENTLVGHNDVGNSKGIEITNSRNTENKDPIG